MERSTSRITHEKRIYLVQDFICTHLDQELNLEQLARISAFSPFHFHRIFKSITGETLYEFVKRIRLEKSCTMLSSNPDMKITTIAMNCGFSTSSSFSKAFKKFYNITPLEYRNCNSLNNSNSENYSSKNGTYNSKSGKDVSPPIQYISDKKLEILYKRRRKMNVKIEELPEYRIAYMRQIGPYGTGNIQLMQKLKKWAITRDLLTESSIILGIAHDDPKITPPDKCRYDTCIVITNNYKLESGMNESKLPGGKYSVLSIKHTADAIGKAWNDIFSVWLPDSGYQIDDRPFFERYMGANVTKIQPLSCEICIPVRLL